MTDPTPKDLDVRLEQLTREGPIASWSRSGGLWTIYLDDGTDEPIHTDATGVVDLIVMLE